MKPYFKETVWGGNSLHTRFNKECGNTTGESWEISIRSGCECVIANGEYAGMTLGDYLEADAFPLLIKFIDAADKLSVQVHPSEKNELWYIIDAAPDAEIIYGTAENADINKIKNAGDGIEKYLRHIKVKAGDVFYIPAGQIHALGAGILIAEIQQNSDTTYRLYDYGRPRELHRDKALQEIKLRGPDEIHGLQYSRGSGGIANCEYFKITEHFGEADLDIRDSFSAIVAVGGSGALLCEGKHYTVSAGDTYFIPQGCEHIRLTGSSHILEVKPSSV